MTPRVSILLPVHNGSFLAEAAETLLQQTERDFELLILDDASDGVTQDLIARYAADDQRIKVLRNDENRGLPATLNRGLREAQAELIARADADDIYHPERLSRQLHVF
ncbi:MAG: glycosyltransferase family A protein, partial [Pseudomonadota bacterium]